jgi:hypothetical protein
MVLSIAEKTHRTYMQKSATGGEVCNNLILRQIPYGSDVELGDTRAVRQQVLIPVDRCDHPRSLHTAS